jgi:hypothetical protein
LFMNFVLIKNDKYDQKYAVLGVSYSLIINIKFQLMN